MNDVSRWDSDLYEDDLRNCTEEGLMCKSCKQVALCISDGEGGFKQVDTETCDSEKQQTCKNAKCTTEANPSCVEEISIAFPCTSKGVFPDPYNCKKYYICCVEGNTRDVNNCDKDHAYDPVTTYCKTPLKNQTCTELSVPKCTKPGQLDALVKNKSIYYICQMKTTEAGQSILYPVQYLCPNGKSFVNNRCT